MKFPLYSRVALAVDVPAEGIRRGDVATVVEHHAAPDAGGEQKRKLNKLDLISNGCWL